MSRVTVHTTRDTCGATGYADVSTDHTVTLGGAFCVRLDNLRRDTYSGSEDDEQDRLGNICSLCQLWLRHVAVRSLRCE